MSLWTRTVGRLFASSSSITPPLPGLPNYEGAARGRRTAAFNSTRAGVNAALIGSLETMRARSHALMRTDPFVWRAIRAYVANLIGTGITPQSLVADQAQRQALSELWTDWTDEADADGRTDFYGLQVQIALAFLLGGECFVRLRKRLPEDNLSVPLQLQVLEADHCPVDFTRTEAGGNQTRCGIEFGPIGNRVAYWLYPEHPNDQIGASVGNLTPVRVPAEQVLHIFEAIRPGQLRGEPRLARVLLTAFHLDQYDDATLDKAKLGSTLTGWIKQQLGDGMPPTVDADATADSSGTVEQVVEPGTMGVLREGEEIQFAPAPDLGTYIDFHRAGVRKLATGTGSTFEHTSGDYEGVTYSSLREQKNQLERECEQVIYATFVPQLCQPVRRMWLQQAMLAGALPAIAARDYATNPRRYLRTNWVYPGLAHADPLKETLAAKERIRAGLTSVSAEIRRQGLDPEKVFAERAADFAVNRLLGAPLDVDPSLTGALTAPAIQPDAPPATRRRAA